MNGNRGAKGSVNDRIISMLYRKRYLEYLKKKESYTALERKRAEEYLEKLRTFDIDNNVSSLDEEDKKILGEALTNFEVDLDKVKVESPNVTKVKLAEQEAAKIETMPQISDAELTELTQLGEKISEYDPETEEYDFDKYDYYEVLNNKTGIANTSEDEVIDVESEITKLDDEAVIIKEVTDFVDDSKEILNEIKDELDYIKDELDNQHTYEEISTLDERYDIVKNKLAELRRKYFIIREKYGFEDYEILTNITLMEAIDDYKNKAKLDELERMVDACKEEVEKIDGVIVEDKKAIGINEEIDDRKEEIKVRDQQFGNAKKDTIYYDNLEKQIQVEAIKQKEIISDLEQKIAKVNNEVVKTKEYVFQTGRMFSSFLRITAGILTAPLSQTRIFGTMLGTHLINRGLKDLRTSFLPTEVERVKARMHYDSVESEILNTKDEVGTTLKLIDDSLYQVNALKKDFVTKFQKYSSYIPEYTKVENMLTALEKKLLLSKEQVNSMNKTLDKQYEKNKQKVLKANNS